MKNEPGLDSIDLEAMNEGHAISKLRGFRGPRIRMRKEENVRVSDIRVQKAWDSIKEKK